MASEAASSQWWCHSCGGHTTVIEMDGEQQCTQCQEPFVEMVDADTEEFVPEPADQPAPSENQAQPGVQVHSFQWGPQSVSIQAGGGNVFGQLLEGLFRPMQQPENQERVADAANNFFGQMLDGLMGGLRQGAAAGGGAAGGVGGAGAAAAAGFNLDSLFNLRNLNIGNFNLGDFAGGNINNVISQLMAQDRTRYGPPPASKAAVAALPTIVLTAKDVAALQFSDCAVCKDELSEGETVRRLDCSHSFHQECIMPWLEHHNTCPVCRFQMPTDDPWYEQQRQALASSTPQQEAEQQEQQEQQERQEEAPGVQSEPDPQEQQQERQVVEAPQVQSEPDHPSRTLQQGQGDGQDSQEGIEEEQRAGDHAHGDSPVIAEVDVVD